MDTEWTLLLKGSLTPLSLGKEKSFSSNFQEIVMVKLFEQQNMLSNDDGVSEQRISL